MSSATRSKVEHYSGPGVAALVPPSRDALAPRIAARILEQSDALRTHWTASTPVAHAVLDGVLGADAVAQIRRAFPSPESLHLRSTLRERKRVGIDLEAYDDIISDILFAFQDPLVVKAVEDVTGLTDLVADPSLYASGISVMGGGDFLSPHLDNSHDGDGRHYRAVNLLYYVNEPMPADAGGQLELWDAKVRQATCVEPLPDRLVLMLTTNTSWHSVAPLNLPGGEQARLCVSNYLFSPEPPGGTPYRHVTTFRGRPGQPVKRVVLRLDGLVRNMAGRVAPWLQRRSFHRRS